jgi:type I restriction-modification system DNA methylase subunit
LNLTSKLKLNNPNISYIDIFNHAFLLVLKQHGIQPNYIKNILLKKFILNININESIFEQLIQQQSKISMKDLETIYEQTITKDIKEEKGIVYTPDFIIDYLIGKTIDFNNIQAQKIIDPACGCGAFLLRIIDKYSQVNKKGVISFVENQLYGIDIDGNHIKIVELLINLKLVLIGEDYPKIKLNLETADALKNDWSSLFSIKEKFDFIIGNPPYIKVQTMKEEYMNFLSQTFETTKSGGFNIFYAFIEKSMLMLDPKGKLGFIIPNNFLKIKSGKSLRVYIIKNHYLDTLIDFSHNMIFAPVMTYNAIIILSKFKNSFFSYKFIPKINDVSKPLNNKKFSKINNNQLHEDQWILLDDDSMAKIKKIQSFPIKIGQFIKTGIATLKDALFIVKKTDNKFIASFGESLYEIEPELIRPLYKIPEIKSLENITNFRNHIIFPYKLINGLYKPIPKTILENNYPKAFRYFLAIETELNKRSNSHLIKPFYAYGRSQGLNNQGEKLMYAQFLGKPKFIHNTDAESLFSNGFAIYENNKIELKLLKKIIQSSIFEWYISKVSYSIDGGFYCYQKKYLKDFSIPILSTKEKKDILNGTDVFVESFLKKIYE